MVYARSSQDGPQNCKSCGSKKWVHSGECSDCVDCGREICSECAGCNIEGVLTCANCIEDLLEEQPNEDPDCTCVYTDVDRVDPSGCPEHGRRVM